MRSTFHPGLHRMQHTPNLVGVRTGCQQGLLRATQFRGRDKLHRARDLLSILHRANTAPKIEKCGHLLCTGRFPRHQLLGHRGFRLRGNETLLESFQRLFGFRFQHIIECLLLAKLGQERCVI
jgi:hypothetical protein